MGDVAGCECSAGSRRIEMTTTIERWYRVPVIWLGVAVLFASLAGCAFMVVLALRYPAEPALNVAPTVLKIPATREPESAAKTTQ